VPVYKKGDKKYPIYIKNMKILIEVPLPRLIPYAHKITEDHQRGFQYYT
jgi:hypothetical protein